MSTKIKTPTGWKTVANLSQSDVIRNPDWANAVAITAAQLNVGYAAPADGMFVGRWVNSSSAGAEMTINNVAVGVASNNTSGMLQCAVSSGDVIKNNGTTGTSGVSFVPFKVSGSGGIHYSTDEELTGDFWIDGKPVYRKVCPISVLSSWGPATITDPPRDVLKIVHSDFTLTTGGIERTPFTQNDNTGAAVVFQHSNEGTIIAYGMCTPGNATGHAIFEYTKTTD